MDAGKQLVQRLLMRSALDDELRQRVTG